MNQAEQILKEIENWDSINVFVFSRIIALVVKSDELMQKKLAQEFEIHETTVLRWAAGTSVPAEEVRKKVIAKIKKDLSISVK